MNDNTIKNDETPQEPEVGVKVVKRISNSFNLDEVDGLMQLFSELHKNGDVSKILKSDAVRGVHRKFLKMRTQLYRR